MLELSGSRALVEALEREGVSVIFGLPGGAIMPVYDALLDSGIRHILARHEQSAAHMADGYARASGRAGVCMATSGPGSTNLVTGIANAYMDSSPVVAFTGQVPRAMIGRDAFQEADIIGITAPITKYNYQVRSASEIPSIVKKAFLIATSGRPGPVLVDLPKDVQTEVAQMEFPDTVEVRGFSPPSDPDPELLKRAAELLAGADAPFILAGGGVRISNAHLELLRLAELLMAPVGTTLMGKGCIREDHPLSVGVIGMHGSPLANTLIVKADVLLAVGTRFADRTTCDVKEFCKEAEIIHIDIDPAEIGKNKRVRLGIVGDARKALARLTEELAKRLKGERPAHWYERIKQVKAKLQNEGNDGLSAPRLLKRLRKLLPDDAIVTTEVGQNQMWASLHFKAYGPRNFITSGGLGTMGFGFPAAIGAKVARPEVPVVDIAGDGSFQMTMNSLATSVSERIPVVVVILNNRMLGMVAQWQRLFFRGRYSAVEINPPDFAKIAEAYGAQGIRAESMEEFERAVKAALASDVTTVIDVPINPEEDVFPMVPPGCKLEDMIGV
ncbi:MAG: biosynthetic-type acetolactate synthase large subunit [Candidatus Bathyarchaeia archaeon]